MPSHTVAPPPIFHHSPLHVGGLAHRLVLEAFRRIARHGVEAPRPLAGVRVERVDEAAHRILRSAAADDDLALRDPRRHRQRVLILRIRDARFPHRLSGQRVERDQASVDDRRDHLVLVERDAAIDDAAADLGLNGGAVHLRIPLPELLAGPRVDGEDDAPRGDAVEHAVRDQRRRFLVAAAGRVAEVPGMSNDQARPSRLTLVASICFSGL